MKEKRKFSPVLRLKATQTESRPCDEEARKPPADLIFSLCYYSIQQNQRRQNKKTPHPFFIPRLYADIMSRGLSCSLQIGVGDATLVYPVSASGRRKRDLVHKCMASLKPWIKRKTERPQALTLCMQNKTSELKSILTDLTNVSVFFIVRRALGKWWWCAS